MEKLSKVQKEIKDAILGVLTKNNVRLCDAVNCLMGATSDIIRAVGILTCQPNIEDFIEDVYKQTYTSIKELSKNPKK